MTDTLTDSEFSERHILAFLQEVAAGMPVVAAHKGGDDLHALVQPTLEQRMKAALTLLEKVQTMKQKSGNGDTPAAISHEQIATIKQAILGKLAGLAEQKKARRVSRKPDAS